MSQRMRRHLLSRGTRALALLLVLSWAAGADGRPPAQAPSNPPARRGPGPDQKPADARAAQQQLDVKQALDRALEELLSTRKSLAATREALAKVEAELALARKELAGEKSRGAATQ